LLIVVFGSFFSPFWGASKGMVKERRDDGMSNVCEFTSWWKNGTGKKEMGEKMATARKI